MAKTTSLLLLGVQSFLLWNMRTGKPEIPDSAVCSASPSVARSGPRNRILLSLEEVSLLHPPSNHPFLSMPDRRVTTVLLCGDRSLLYADFHHLSMYSEYNSLNFL